MKSVAKMSMEEHVNRNLLWRQENYDDQKTIPSGHHLSLFKRLKNKTNEKDRVSHVEV